MELNNTAEKRQDHADVKIHPPILTLFHLLAVFALDWVLPFPKTMPQISRWLGILSVLAGLTFAILTVNRFRAAHTTLDPHGSVSMVITNGPFRFSRNPIYVGYVCILIGFPAALGTYWGIILSPLLIVLMNTYVIKHEEAYLEEKFGEAYTGYKSRVRRWM